MHDSGVKQPNLADRLIQMFGDFLNLVIVDPDNSWSSRAAVTALAAGEVESFRIPWLFGFVPVWHELSDVFDLHVSWNAPICVSVEHTCFGSGILKVGMPSS